jgi:hypothetical protein
MNAPTGARARRANDRVVSGEELVQRLELRGSARRRRRDLVAGRVVDREAGVDRLDHVAVADAEALVRRFHAELVPAVGEEALLMEVDAVEVRAGAGRGRHGERCRPRNV